MNQFKESIRPFRKALWKMRLYIMAYNIITYLNVFDFYRRGELDEMSLLTNLMITVILILFPFAYGLKEEKDPSKNRK